MKCSVVSFCLLLIWGSILFGQEPLKNFIPNEILIDLNAKFPGWEFPQIRDEIQNFVSNEVASGAIPEIISGDFNGDNEKDYAIFISHKDPKPNSKLDNLNLDWHVLVYLKEKSSDGFSYFKLLSGQGSPSDNYLLLCRKCEKDFDYDTENDIVYENDAIFVGFFEKAGITYVFENNKFNKIITSD